MSATMLSNLSFSLLYKNLKIKIRRNIILCVVLHGCDNWSPHSGGRTCWGYSRVECWGTCHVRSTNHQVPRYTVFSSTLQHPPPYTPPVHYNLRIITCFRCLEREIRKLPSVVFRTRCTEGWRDKTPRKENWYWGNIRFWGIFQAAWSWLDFSCSMEVSVHIWAPTPPL